LDIIHALNAQAPVYDIDVLYNYVILLILIPTLDWRFGDNEKRAWAVPASRVQPLILGFSAVRGIM
jgi:hypothetical protein